MNRWEPQTNGDRPAMSDDRRSRQVAGQRAGGAVEGPPPAETDMPLVSRKLADSETRSQGLSASVTARTSGKANGQGVDSMATSKATLVSVHSGCGVAMSGRLAQDTGM